MMQFKLKEYVGHKSFQWKDSLVNFCTENVLDTENLSVKCCNDEFPCQVNRREDGKFNISFIINLSPDEEKDIILCSTDKKYENIAYTSENIVIMQNSKIKIVVNDADETLFSVTKSDNDIMGLCTLSRPVKCKKTEIVENGPVYAIVRIEAVISDTEKYIVKIKLAQSQEFFEITEEIDVCKEFMQIEWQNYLPDFRTGIDVRKKERSDAYLKSDGEVPFALLPHDVTNGTTDSTFAGFYNENVSVGAFVANSIMWNDGSYSIQGNNRINAVRFYCPERRLTFRYPLNHGTRQTCVALYDSETKFDLACGSYIRELQFKNYYLPLDIYKDWIFNYDDSDEHYPVYFDKSFYGDDEPCNFLSHRAGGIPPAEKVRELVFNLDVLNDLWYFGPVWSRCMCELIPVLDLRANEMSREDFVKCRNVCIYFAYYAMLENPFPSRHTLGSHANFFADYVSIVGLASAMFPNHPEAAKWKTYHERAVALTLKFYVRPDVDAWKAKGGRPTESVGCYAWGGMKHLLEPSEMMKVVYDDDEMLHPNFAKWSEFSLNVLSAPLDGRRAFPPMGAHAGGHELNPFYAPYLLRVMGNKLKYYDPILTEQILNVCPANPLVTFESFGYTDPWVYMNTKTDADNEGIKPDLKSEKYTGFGYVLRSHVNETDEMCVFLQQIDEGPNYRWGVANQGGCGNIYYYADNKRFSDNRKEDAGDDVMRDGETTCCFTVLKGNTYRSLGMNELTYPLSDFEFLKYARANAGSYSNDKYKYRSVMMVENEYIVVYDAVSDIRTKGRFSWFTNMNDDFPNIYQLKPGAKKRDVLPPELTVDGVSWNHRANGKEILYTTKGIMYDGFGDFLTIVTHKENLDVNEREYGAVVRQEGKTDYIFNAEHTSEVKEDNIEFLGKIGYIRVFENSDFNASIVEGKKITVDDCSLEISSISEHFSVSFSKMGERFTGKCEGEGVIKLTIENISGFKFYINNEEFKIDERNIEVKLCNDVWEICKDNPVPQRVTQINHIEENDGVVISCNTKCDEYIFTIDGKEYKSFESKLKVVLEDGKHIVTVCGKNGEILGENSYEYPLYVTKDKPHRVEGLQVKKHKDFYEISWGKQLGILKYDLYRNDEVIYSGQDTGYKDFNMVKNLKYYVVAVNNFGESEISRIYDTSKSDETEWDPMPETEFVRDTIVNEHGYPGFDFKYNENRKILKYPN